MGKLYQRARFILLKIQHGKTQPSRVEFFVLFAMTLFQSNQSVFQFHLIKQHVLNGHS